MYDISIPRREEVILMCNGQDEMKPHLHYSSISRSIAARLEKLLRQDAQMLLRISTTVGLLAMCDQLREECHDVAGIVDSMKYAKLLATRELAAQAVEDLRREHQDWVNNPIRAMLYVQDDLPF
jgi:hypothetical protein